MKIRFGPFTLDLETRQLMQESRDIHLSPKAFELLAVLAADRPRVLSKVTLQERLWPDTYVTEANLSNLIAEIRRALGDRGRQPMWIRTSHGFGYAFCGDAEASQSRGVPSSGPLTCWLEWGRQRFALSMGEHIIGRDPDVQIRLDAPSVSRRHARLSLTADGALLEDFGSKNGTRHGNLRVASPVRLADGDAIHIGALLLTFHARPSVVSTDTLADVLP